MNGIVGWCMFISFVQQQHAVLGSFLKMSMAPPRRSARLQAPTTATQQTQQPLQVEAVAQQLTRNSVPTSKIQNRRTSTFPSFLPRTRELQLLQAHQQQQQKSSSHTHHATTVIGVDEAGRGPLAGPVVVAALYSSKNINGVCDSKTITNEHVRNELYEQLVRDSTWAVAIMDAACIDEVNILQATMQGMQLATKAVMGLPCDTVQEQASIEHEGCYVVTNYQQCQNNKNNYYALVDGNRVPSDMPCPAEFIIKGDSKEYCIAAASVVAKVTRDRLMHAWHDKFPAYNFAQHKGYPTKAHMAAIFKEGACTIHRRTFAPLKSMELDANGAIVGGVTKATEKKET
jgi:ribonuclease HII